MGDMGEFFRDWDEAKKERRRERFDAADDFGWKKHTEHHWYRYINGKKINYWPSSGLCMYMAGKKHKRKNINGREMREMIEKDDQRIAELGKDCES